MNAQGIYIADPRVVGQIGSDAAIFLQKLEYWSVKCGKSLKGEHGVWTYNTYKDWQKQFPFWSLSKIGRIIRTLKKESFIKTKKANAKYWNQTNWYQINFEAYNKTVDEKSDFKDSLPSNPSQIKKEGGEYRDKRGSVEVTNSVEAVKDSLSSPKRERHSRKTPRVSPRGVVEKKEEDTAKKLIDIWEEKIPPRKESESLSESGHYTLLGVFRKNFESDLEKWENFASFVSESPFLMGKVNEFRVQLSWALHAGNLKNILEGKYHLTRKSRAKRIEKNTGIPLQELRVEVDHPAWRGIRKEAETKWGRESYLSWVAKLRFVSFEGGILKLEAPMNFIKDEIEARFLKGLEDIALSQRSGIKKIKIVVSGDLRNDRSQLERYMQYLVDKGRSMGETR